MNDLMIKILTVIKSIDDKSLIDSVFKDKIYNLSKEKNSKFIKVTNLAMSCFGCTDSKAANYDEDAIFDDDNETCEYK